MTDVWPACWAAPMRLRKESWNWRWGIDPTERRRHERCSYHRLHRSSDSENRRVPRPLSAGDLRCRGIRIAPAAACDIPPGIFPHTIPHDVGDPGPDTDRRRLDD